MSVGVRLSSTITYSRVSDASVERVIGQSPAELMNDDSLGAGLQMALFDVVGKILEVPVYQLLDNQCREAVPISWWCIDSSPEKLGSRSRRCREKRLYQFQK